MSVHPLQSSPEFRVLTAKQVDLFHPVSRATRWRMIRAGEFPKPIRLSKGRVAWLEQDLLAWMKTREAKR